MKAVKIIVILLVLFCVAFWAYVNRKRIIGILRHDSDKKANNKEEMPVNAKADICQAFLMYADNFQGLLEPMYKASVGNISHERMKNVLSEWNIRMRSIVQAPIGLKSWWATIVADINTFSDKEMQDCSQQIVEMIKDCGIVRDNRSDFVATEDTGMYYQESNDNKITVGQNLRVDSPCWYLPSNPVRIIEKGNCEII